MHDNTPVEQTTDRSVELGYEDSDVAIPVLMKWWFGLLVMVGIVSFVVLGLYVVLASRATENTKTVALSSIRRLPPTGLPMLQADPILDIKTFRADENHRIAGYGHWKDGDKKDAVFVPLDRAMEIVLQSPETHNLKVQTTPYTNNVTPPVTDRGMPSSQPGNVTPRVIAPDAPPNYGSDEMPVSGPDNHYLPSGP